MIGIDTNILVRYITQGDQQQSSRANKLMEKKLTQDNYALISKIVLCELSWVLSSAYNYSKEQIGDIVQQILITQELFVEDAENALQALQALQYYRKGKAGFADYFLAQTHNSMGAVYTVTFDRKALQDELFRSV